MSVTKEQIMLTLNLDETDDVSLIPAYIKTAEIYIKNAVGDADGFFETENVKDLYDTAVIALASAYYTYRVALADTMAYPIDLTLNSIIGQLRGLYAVYCEETLNG
ncbi:phage gp6-like head-tail connector protein [Streptococcus ruminicola]|uniref:Phage gp6-like head-tail connector protein n=1 Tax=Streptococcus ruminicola TaxID=2686210 RepID=A0A6G8HXV9_9STRE|nr:head-tail connector protein [Streptococcus ruminicola]QIM45737.1 phage gp6-like head-tail connector protein [Streptococcus ruminicola]